MKKILLAIGDLMMSPEKKAPSVNKFLRYRHSIRRRNIDFEFITYDDLLLNRLPDIKAEKIKVMLFFPYAHWNSQIERYDKDDRIYGDASFGKEYKLFFKVIDGIIRKKYRDKALEFVNPTASCILDRDKKKTADALNKAGIKTPRIFNIRRLSQLYRLLDEAGPLYIKPVFGSMGKGITYLCQQGCYTNYIFRRNKVISRPYDYNWKFVRIGRSRQDDFLKIIIDRRFLFQEAVEKPVLNKRVFDLRLYAIYDEIAYMYAKSSPCKNFITNWSQGGRIEKRRFLKKALPEDSIERIKEISRQAARILDLNYAGVDVLPNKDCTDFYLLEIHSFPGYERGFNLMRFLADRI